MKIADMRAPRFRAPRGARRGSAVFSVMLTVPDPPRGRPAGGGGNYHNRGYGGLNPHYPMPLPVYHANDVSSCPPQRNFPVYSLVDRMKTPRKIPKCPRGN
jgi:hypothetical protein